MNYQVNIYEAKTHLLKLINKTLKGDEIIITRNGKPLVRLIPYSEEKQERRSGQFKGLIKISNDFDAPLPDDLLKAFYGP